MKKEDAPTKTNILEFSSARLQLHRVILDQIGLEQPVTWRVVGRPHDHFTDGELYASPFIVAYHREGRACAVNLRRGVSPESLARLDQLTAALDAALVTKILARQGYELNRVDSWVVFDCGGHHEIDATEDARQDLAQRAHRAVRERQLRHVSTRTVASLL